MADMKAFATKENADSGVWFPVRIGGVKYPLALRLYGIDSDAVQQYERQRIRKMRISKKGTAEIDDDTIDEILDSYNDMYIVRIGGISSYDWKNERLSDEPVTWGTETLGNDRKSYSLLVENIPALRDFIREKSDERSNFLSEEKRN